jgi:trk system potassium uptake protein TrkH
MNYRAIVFILGTLLLVLSACMIPSLMWAVYYGEYDIFAFSVSILITLITGIVLRKLGSLEGNLGIRDGFLIVTTGWTLAGIVGALPFIFYGAVENFIDGFFETVSGFTTTGATVINDIEILPHGILFWRSFTHWLGGMGIIVLFLALLPKIGGGLQLFKAEVPGPTAEKVSPRLTRTAKVLWFIYLGLTVIQTVLLMISGFSLFDALIHTFGTVATGGFSTKNLSVGAFGNPAAEIIIIMFMVISGVNFSLYYHFLNGDRKKLTKDSEFRFYICIIFIATTLIAFNLRDLAPSLPALLRTSAFQVVSIMTTTGFATENFDAWPDFSKLILLLLMFLGDAQAPQVGPSNK